MKVLSVTSGGMDSMSMAAAMLHDGNEVALFHANIGQKAERPEEMAVLRCCGILNVKAHIIELPWLGAMGGSSLTDKNIEPTKGIHSLQESLLITSEELEKQKAGRGLWTPARNVVLLACAASLAERYGFDCLTWGANQSETAYPDNTMEFAVRFQHMLEYGCLRKITMFAPLYDLDKVEILRWGYEHGYGEIFRHTWSCDLGFEYMCGECGCCMNRRLSYFILNEMQIELDGKLYHDLQKYENNKYFKDVFLHDIQDETITKKMWFDKYRRYYLKSV